MQKKISPKAIYCLAVVTLLTAGAFIPLVALANPGGGTGSQLQAAITAAESSRIYAARTVYLAQSEGLDVSSAQSQISAGDSLLATARSDLSVVSSIAAGILAANMAMNDYSEAATSASAVISDSSLKANVSIAAAFDAIAEVNATLKTAATVETQACSTISVSSSSLQAFQHACAQVSAQVANATLAVRQAYALAVQAHASVGASVNIEQALGLVATARAKVSTAALILQTVASFTYLTRASAYIAAQLLTVSSSANATIRSEEAVRANYSAAVSDFNTTTVALTSGTNAALDAGNKAATQISSTSTSSVNAGAQAAEETTAHVASNLTALNNIIASIVLNLPVVTTLKSSIQTAETATTNFNQSVKAVVSFSDGFASTQVGKFGGYVSSLQAAQLAEQSSASAYVAAYSDVQGNLTALISTGLISGVILTQLQQARSALATLQLKVSTTVSVLAAGLSAEVTQVQSVSSATAAYAAAVASASAQILVRQSLTAQFAAIVSSASIYLNSTSAAELEQVSTSVSAAAATAAIFSSSLQGSLQSRVSGFVSLMGSITASGNLLIRSAASVANQAMMSSVYLADDVRARTALVADANAQISQAMAFFAAQNVTQGSSAMASASVELDAAAQIHISFYRANSH